MGFAGRIVRLFRCAWVQFFLKAMKGMKSDKGDVVLGDCISGRVIGQWRLALWLRLNTGRLCQLGMVGTLHGIMNLFTTEAQRFDTVQPTFAISSSKEIYVPLW